MTVFEHIKFCYGQLALNDSRIQQLYRVNWHPLYSLRKQFQTSSKQSYNCAIDAVSIKLLIFCSINNSDFNVFD